MCQEHKMTYSPWARSLLVSFVILLIASCVAKAGFFEAKAQTPTPINKRFSQTSVRVYGNDTQVLIDNQTGIACYRLSDSSGYPWSCAQMKGGQ